MDQRGCDQVDAAVVQDVRSQRGSTPVSCSRYNLGNFLRTLGMPEPIKDWSLTSKEKLIKIGAKVVSHGRYIVCQIAGRHSHDKCSRRFCGSSRNWRLQPPPAPV
jgi:hypothetical protein